MPVSLAIRFSAKLTDTVTRSSTCIATASIIDVFRSRMTSQKSRCSRLSQVFFSRPRLPEAVRAVAECDVVFSCMDGVEGCHVLNIIGSLLSI